MPERLARTVCEIDPNPHSPFGVAVILEVLGYTDGSAKAAGWPSIFVLAREIYHRIEFLRGDAAEQPDERSRRPDVPSALSALVAQHAAWLLMVVLMVVWGQSVWSAENLPLAAAAALVAGIFGSLVVSGGFQYAITRRLLFHVAQRDLTQAAAFLHRALWAGGLVMSVGALAVGGGFWLANRADPLIPLLAGGYFLLHGNYRVAVVALVALQDVAGILLSTGAGGALLILTYLHLAHSGMDKTLAVATAQFAGLGVLWLGSVVRGARLLRTGAFLRTPPGPELREANRRAAPPGVRWPVLCLDSLPWVAIGMLYYLFLFGLRPIGWMLPPAERPVFESGIDLGMLGLIPVAIATSWGLHRYFQGLREELLATTIPAIAALRVHAAARLTRITWLCRGLGAIAAVLLLKLTEGAHWGGMGTPAIAVVRLTLVGTVAVFPTLLLSFGLLTSLGALRDAIGVLACGLALQLGGGLGAVRLGTAGWLALAFVAAAAVVGELARWRAHQVVRHIDRFYYAVF